MRCCGSETGRPPAQVLEAAFKNETVGLVTREEFMNKRNTIKDRMEQEEERRKRAAEAEAAGTPPFPPEPSHGCWAARPCGQQASACCSAARKAERQRKKQRTQAKSKLSFAEEEDLQEEEREEEADGQAGDGKEASCPQPWPSRLARCSRAC